MVFFSLPLSPPTPTLNRLLARSRTQLLFQDRPFSRLKSVTTSNLRLSALLEAL